MQDFQSSFVKNEKDFVYGVPFDAAMYNEKGSFYPAALQRIVTRLSEEHLQNIEFDVPRLIKKYGVAWVLLSMSVELKRPLRPTDTLHAQTWNTQQHPPLYRRELALYDEREQPVAVAATYCSLLDLRERHICTDKAILESFRMPEGPMLLEAESRFHEHPAFSLAAHEQVHPSWIDGLGHVNNSRYGDFVYDALSEEERARIGSLTRMDVWFLAELKPGMAFDIETARCERTVFVRGMIQPEGKPSFLMKLTF